MLKDYEGHARRIARERRMLPLSDSVYSLLVAMIETAGTRRFVDLQKRAVASRHHDHKGRQALVAGNARRPFQHLVGRRAATIDEQLQRR